MKQYLVLDYETRSECDLKKSGAYEYARDPSTEILCVGWTLLDHNLNRQGKTKVWSPFLGGNVTKLFWHLCNDSTTLVAHNAFFEQVITKFVLSKYFYSNKIKNITPSRWMCTAALSAPLALPRSLEGACLALELPIKKDMEGRRLILKYCKPRRATKHNSRKFHNSTKDLRRIMEYCGTDIDATIELFKKLPPLHPNERKIWELNQKINMRGFGVDLNLVDATLKLIEKETENLNEETNRLTRGVLRSTNQREKLLHFVKAKGLPWLKDLTSGSVKEALSTEIKNPDVRRLLEIRQAISKTSTKKYAAFALRAETDGRVRDYILYHGASTGRDSGQGVQPHNFPRGTIPGVESAIDVIKGYDLSLLRLLYGNPMEVFSSALRGVIVASVGKELFCSDYSGIEARILLWLADDFKGLDVFRRGLDPYKILAAIIFSKPVELVTPAERELGKRAELACGFGMGWKKFIETCASFGDKSVTEELAQKAVSVFREVHAPVVKLWGLYERAAIYATLNPGKKITINKTKWFVDKNILFCELPSGRRLAYYGPKVKYRHTPWGEKKPTLYHWSVHPKTRKWSFDHTYGGKLVENVVQAVARDVMKNGELALEDAGYEVLLTVHDEILSERDSGCGTIEEYDRIMQTLPAWAKGLPIKTKGWVGSRYRK